LQVIDARALVEPVQLLRFFHVGLAEYTQNVEVHFFPLQQFDALHHSLPGAASLLVETVAVVEFFRSVQGHAEEPSDLCPEEQLFSNDQARKLWRWSAARC
jgi:hypothetical protein